MNVPLDEVIFFDCITTHPSTGAATDADSTPTFAVYEENTDTDIGVGGNLTKRTSLTGNYRGTFTLSTANGFEVGKWYSIIGSATVNSIAGKAVLKNFRVVAAEAIAGKTKVDVDALLGTAWLTPGTAGTPDVNAKLIGATTQTGRDLGASVLLSSGTGTGQIKIASGYVAPNWGDVGNPTTTNNLSGTTVKAITDAPPDSAGVTTLLTRITSGLFTGITSLAQWLGLIAGKQTGDSTARTEVRATGAGSGTFDETTDSQEALRDRGDVAWTTATGFSTHSASDVWAVGTRTLTAFDAAFKTGYALSSAGVQAIWDALTSALTTVGSIGKLLVDRIDAAISSRSSQTSVDDLPTNAELATALGTADDAVLAAIAALNNLSQANIRTAIGLASANLDTQLGDLPTNSELATALAAADDAILAAIAALNNLPAGAAMTLTSAERNAVADALMVRASSNWEASAPAQSLGTAVMKAIHKTEENSGDLEIYRSNGTTVHAMQSITTDAGSEPIKGLGGAV